MAISPAWLNQLRNLVAPRGISGQVYATDANVYLAAFLCIVAIAALAGWLAYHPAQVRRSRILLACAVLLLAVIPALFFGFRTTGQAVLLNPYEVWLVLRIAFFSIVHDATFFADVFAPESQHRIAATGCLLLLVLAFAVALRRPQSTCARWGGVALAVAFAAYPIAHLAQRYAAKREVAVAYEKGKSLFDQVCGAARASRTVSVPPVEGIRLLQIRADAPVSRLEDRNWPDAGIPGDQVGQAYIASFLDFEFMDDPASHPSWGVALGMVTMTGYRHVDVAQPDGSYLRYRLDETTRLKSDVRTEVIPAGEAARYAVAYTRNDTPQDRENWLAGAVVKVTDTATGDVLGELHAFAFAPPSRDEFNAGPDKRSWAAAQTCPAVDMPGVEHVRARMFAGEVAKPLYVPLSARGKPSVPAAPGDDGVAPALVF